MDLWHIRRARLSLSPFFTSGISGLYRRCLLSDNGTVNLLRSLHVEPFALDIRIFQENLRNQINVTIKARAHSAQISLSPSPLTSDASRILISR